LIKPRTVAVFTQTAAASCTRLSKRLLSTRPSHVQKGAALNSGFARLSMGGFIGMPSSARVVGPVAVLCSSGNGYRTFISAAEKESTTFQNSLALALVSLGATLFGFHSLSPTGLVQCEHSPQPQKQNLSESSESESQGSDPTSTQWQDTIDKSVKGIVSIVFSTPRAFDTESPGSSQATGFVVDAEQGIILTNKHVVHEGPINARVIFSNHEEVAAYPLYRDPVHDFGFLKIDPKELKYITPTELPLCPEKAKRGLEIRVIGNNAGEKLSILSGTLARLDRQAPNTGISADFNTFYIQAASGTSGGSSGSPVIDKDGNVVALNAAGRMLTAVSYYLPLDRVVRALDFVQKNELVPRGTIQTVWSHKPFGDLTKLGLVEAEETSIRSLHPDTSGMLTVNAVVPGGTASNKLEPGDILLSLNGNSVVDFTSLEEITDNSVGNKINLEIARGATRLCVQVDVQDLAHITPSSFLEMGESIFNNLSYHTARHYNIPVGGAYVSKMGYMLLKAGISTGCVITDVKGTKINNITDLAQALAKFKDGDIVPVRIYSVAAPQMQRTALLRIDRRWFPMQFATRDDKAGKWVYEQAPAPIDAPSDPSTTSQTATTGTAILKCDDEIATKIAPSLVTVRFSCPYGPALGTNANFFHGSGLVVDAEKGLVVCDRMTVPTGLGDLEIIVSDSIRIPAKTVFIHPYNNIAVIQYDPKLIGDTPLQSCKFSTKRLKRGEAVSLVGMTGNSRNGVEIKSWKAKVGYGAQADGFNLLAMNMDGITLTGHAKQPDGAIVDDDGAVVGLQADFGKARNNQGAHLNLGIPSELLLDVVVPLQKGELPQCNCIGGPLGYIGLIALRDLGLSDERAKKIEDRAEKVGGRRQGVIMLARWKDTDAFQVLQDGDVILSIDGVDIITVRDVDIALQNKPSVNVEVFRQGKIENLQVRPMDATKEKLIPKDRIVLWSGCVIQETPSIIKWTSNRNPKGVFIASIQQGSAGKHHQLTTGSVIVEIDGQPTPDLESFLDIAKQKGTGETVRIKTVSVTRGKTTVSTLELDKQYWPTSLISLNEDGSWERQTVDQDVVGESEHVKSIWK